MHQSGSPTRPPGRSQLHQRAAVLRVVCCDVALCRMRMLRRVVAAPLRQHMPDQERVLSVFLRYRQRRLVHRLQRTRGAKAARGALRSESRAPVWCACYRECLGTVSGSSAAVHRAQLAADDEQRDDRRLTLFHPTAAPARHSTAWYGAAWGTGTAKHGARKHGGGAGHPKMPPQVPPGCASHVARCSLRGDVLHAVGVRALAHPVQRCSPSTQTDTT